MCDEIGNNLATWSSLTQFDDLIWDEFADSTNHIVPEFDDDNEQIVWPTVEEDSRRMLQQEQSLVLPAKPGLISQSSRESSVVIEHITEEKKEEAGFGSHVELETLSPLSVKEEMKCEQTVMGIGDLAAYMMDSMYSKEDVSTGNPPCSSVLSHMNFEESELPFFAEDDDSDKNAVNWDEVDTLLRTNSFAQVLRSNPDELQWPGVLSSSDLWPSMSMPPVRSSPDSDGKLEEFNTKMEFMSMDSPLSLPSLATMQEQGFKKPSYGTDNKNNLESGKQPTRESTINWDETEPMQEGKASAPAQNVDGHVISMAAVETSEDDSGPSSCNLPESEKASIAQVHSAQRHALSCKHGEDKSKRYSKHQKLVQRRLHVSFQEPQQPRPMGYQLLLPRRQDQSSNSHLGYTRDQQQPLIPYMTAGYTPSVHLRPALPLILSCAQMQLQWQGPYKRYHEPRPQRGDLQLPHHLLPQPDMPVPCPSSSSSMTPQEKLEKLRWRQQMQAQLAVEQQQQQLALQGLTAMDVSVLPKMHLKTSESLPVSPLKQSTISLSVKSSSEISPDASRSVGQASTQPLLGEEEQTVEATMLIQLENTIAQLEDRTRLFIRDALYRLARSARQRQATGGSSNQSSEEDSENDIEPSTSGCNPSSSARASRLMKMQLVETQTNPIDRSIAHLLFHQRVQQQPKSGPHFSPAAQDALTPRPSHRTSNGPQMWQSEALLPGKWAPDVNAGVATSPGMSLLQPSTVSNEGVVSSSRGRLLCSMGTAEETGTVVLDQHAKSLPSMPTGNLSSGREVQNIEGGSIVVAQEVPSSAVSFEGGADSTNVGPEAIVPPGSKLSSTGHKEMEAQPKLLQQAAGLLDFSTYVTEEVESLEPAMATDESLVALSSYPSHSVSSAQAMSQEGSLI